MSEKTWNTKKTYVQVLENKIAICPFTWTYHYLQCRTYKVTHTKKVISPIFRTYGSIFWSLDEVAGDLRIHVRTCVRPSVTLLLENRSLLFSETLQLIRAFNSEKNVQTLF